MAYARSCKNAVEYNSPKSVIELFENLWSDTDNPSVIQLSKEQNDFYVKQSNIFLSKLNSRVKRLDQKKLIDVMAMLKSKSENFQELLDFYSKKGNLTTAQWVAFSNELVIFADSIDSVQKFQRAKTALDSFDEHSMSVLVQQIQKFFGPQWFLFHGRSDIDSGNRRAMLIPLHYDLTIRDLLDFVGSGLTPMGLNTTATRVDGITMSPRTFASHDSSGHSVYRPGRLSTESQLVWISLKDWANHPNPEINAIRHILLHQFSHETPVFKDALQGYIQSELNLNRFNLERMIGRVRTEDFWGEKVLANTVSFEAKVKLEFEELQKFYSSRVK